MQSSMATRSSGTSATQGSPPLAGSRFNFSGQPVMSPEAFNAASASNRAYNMSPTSERHTFDRSPTAHRRSGESAAGGTLSDGLGPGSTSVVIHNLPGSMSQEALVSMFLFAEDFVDAHFLPKDSLSDKGAHNAVARFRTLDAADDVRKKLHGKQNASGDGIMLVEVLVGDTESHRRASDDQANRQLSNSASSAGSLSNAGQRQSSRYNKTFQSMERKSPTKLPLGQSASDMSSRESQSFHNFFAPQSPVRTTFDDRTRLLGTSTSDSHARDDGAAFPKDPLTYAQSQAQSNLTRQASVEPPISRLANLRLNTSGSADGVQAMSPPGSGYGFSRANPPLHSPSLEMSPTAAGAGLGPASPSAIYPMSPTQYQRNNYPPPANPADQNPPCNTLYVGNLPLDTSEDELKAIFSKQRGYKRLCFRTKHNGPMCFVEFEDISFATKALNELYGHPLHNSYKGGIRLSFSKNPLGVRTGQNNPLGPTSPLSPTSSGFGNGISSGFGAANGPPPGLTAPPGLSSPIPLGVKTTQGAGMGTNLFSAPQSPPISSYSSLGSFPGYPFGNQYSVNTTAENKPGSSGYSDFGPGR